MESVVINWLGVAVAAVLNMAIGFVWYSKWLFGPFWAKHSDSKPLNEKEARLALLSTLGVSFVIAFFLDFFEAHIGITTVSAGAMLGFCVWLGFVVTAQIGGVIWSKRPWSLFLIDTAGKLLSFLVMGGILGA